MKYLLAILAAFLLATLAWALLERHQLHVIDMQQAAGKQQHTDQLEAAHHEHDQDLSELTAYRAAHPDTGPVQLCSVRLQARAQAPAGAGAAIGVVPAVHGSDNPVRAEQPAQPGPDIARLLKAFAAVAELKNDALREQQAVQ